MTREPAVSLEVALVFTALAVAIVVWVFTRMALDYRQIRQRREALRDKLTPEQFEAWDQLHGILAVLRDRATAWSTDDFVAAQRTLEAVNQFETDALADPDRLTEAATRARAALADFDENPDATRLHVIYESLE